MESASWYTYTPGLGYTGYLPGYDKVPVRWGKEYTAMLEERKAQWEAEWAQNPYTPPLDRTSKLPAPFNPLATFERRTLTKDELNDLATELAYKYDPTNMTDEEYDALLFELVDQGILSENELGLMGLHGQIAVGGGWTIGGWAISTEDEQRYGSLENMHDAHGNALAYAQYIAMRRPLWGDGTWSVYAEAKLSSHKALANVLEAVQRKRQALGLDGESDNTSNACANSSLNSGLTWAGAMTRWKDGSSSSDSLEEEVEDVRNDMYAALDNVLEAAMQRRRLALRRG